MKTAFPPALVAIPTRRLHRISVAQYHRMIQAGVLTEDHNVELLDGFLVAKMPHNPPHDGTITCIHRRLDRVLGDEWIVRVQCAITTKDSEPEPDLVVAKGPLEQYFQRHPSPVDIALAIEVANSTLEDDRYLKGRLYARARIPIYWIANLVDYRIEMYADPRGGKFPVYQQEAVFERSQAVPLVLQGKEIAKIPVKDLLP